MIGGIVYWTAQDRSVTGPTLRAMARRTAGSRATICAEQRALGLFSSTPTDRMESTGPVWVVADLDLTNLAELEALVGQRPRESDLLAALYLRDGPDFLTRLRGAFALALWDWSEQRLLLAVDRFGMRRLHYVCDSQRVAFSSRSTALLAVPGVDSRIDPTAVYQYLNLAYVPAPLSVFSDIRRLEPGQLLLLAPGRASLRQYWDITYREDPITEAGAAEGVYRHLERAVGESLEGIPPKETGAFLSGGTDSSAVLGLMTRLTGEHVNAFSIGFADERYNELGYAELAARHFDAAHYTRIVTPAETLDVLPRLVEAYDEPFGNNSAIGTFFCAQLARECGVTRLLAGDGGDEIFGGNERYRTDRIFASYHRIPEAVRRHVLEPMILPWANPPRPLRRAQRYVRRANIPNPRRFYSYEFFFANDGCGLLAPDFRSSVALDAPHAMLEKHYLRSGADAELNRLLYLDLKLTIGDNDLLKVTRTSELADVAVRFPMLDPDLVDFTSTLPANHKVRGLEKRYLFKRAFRELLPRETLAKPKHGFGVPTSTWLKTELRELAEDVLLSPRTQQRGYFAPGALEQLFNSHRADATPYYGDILWVILMLELWHRRHLELAKAA